MSNISNDQFSKFTADELKELANRFCAWPLPKDVVADLCVTDPDYKFTRSGTNLLTVSQAEEMLRYVLNIQS